MPKPEFLASYWTLAGNVVPLAESMVSPFDFRQRAETASRSGFSGLGLFLDDALASVARYGKDGMRAILDDNGIRYLELEALIDWHATGPRRALSDRQRRQFLDLAAALGAYHIKLVGDCSGDSWPLDHMTAAFAGVCDEAREAGTSVCLEMFPISNIADLPSALKIVQDAGRSNGGILLDVWHVARSQTAMSAIAAIPRGCLAGVELCDGPATPAHSDYFTETIRFRELPGDGAFALSDFLDAVQAAGYTGFYGLEIVSDRHRARSLAEAAATSAAALEALFSGR